MKKILVLLVSLLTITSCSNNIKVNVESQKFEECHNEVDYESFSSLLDQKVRNSILDNAFTNNVDYEGVYKEISNKYTKYSFKDGGEKLVSRNDEQETSTYLNDGDTGVLVRKSKGKHVSNNTNGNLKYIYKNKDIVQVEENDMYCIINDMEDTYYYSSYHSYDFAYTMSNRIINIGWSISNVKFYIDEDVYTWIYKKVLYSNEGLEIEEFAKGQAIFSTYSVSYLYQYSYEYNSRKENSTRIDKMNSITSYEITLKDVDVNRVSLGKYKEI